MSAPRRVRISYPRLAFGPAVTDLDTGEELGKRVPVAGARAFIGVKPGDQFPLEVFRLNAAGERYFEGGRVAMETLELLAVEVVRPAPLEPAAQPSCGCQLCPRHQALQPRYGS